LQVRTRTCRQILVTSVVVAVVGLVMLGDVAWGGGLVFSPDSKPFNKTYSEWSAEWWQFVLSIPAADNPLLDNTGDLCAVGQHGPVWFLAGAFGGTVERACTMPEGKAIFIPVLNLVDINTTSQTADELRAEIDPCLDAVTTVSAELDGQPVPKLRDKFRIRSMVFEITVPVGGFLDPGVYAPVADDGFYVMFQPITAGCTRLTFTVRGAATPSPPTQSRST
jgi:hypothetical protein